MSNHRTPAELKSALDAIVSELQVLDAAAIADAELVPLAKTVQDVAGYVKALDAQITYRVVTKGTTLPGAARKPGITHRKWNDEDTAAVLAFDEIGLTAFKLLSPAAIEKLGKDGEALVAVASFKPEATDRVVY
jgi:hypothetical protein